MRIGLIDVDGHNFPNLPLMKLSAWHKQKGSIVEWYSPMFSGHMDTVYMSKVFEFTPDYEYCIGADQIVKRGSGYCIKVKDGREIYHQLGGINLSDEIEHVYPDYSLYSELTKNTAYGFLTRGCPRNCKFCHVSYKEGKISKKVSDLDTFWRGQKVIKLLDPNLLACKEHEELLHQLIECRAWVDFTQGLDVRLLNKDSINLLQNIKKKIIHFAWDSEKESDLIVKKLELFKKVTHIDRRKASVYVLTNLDTDFAFDLYRINTLRSIGYDPYVMIYDKQHAPYNVRMLQRWVNNKIIWTKCKNFEDYRPELG